MSGNSDGNSWISGRQGGSAEYFTATIYSISVLFVAVNDKKAFNCKSALVITRATRLTLVKELLLLDYNALYFPFSLRDGSNHENRFYCCESADGSQ